MIQAAAFPTLHHERRLWARGFVSVAGLDEAGRGAWAGPVVAAAVVLGAKDRSLPDRLAGVRDSKKLTPRRRESLFDRVRQCAVTWGVGTIPPADIDSHGIVAATRQAMVQAIQALEIPPDYLLIDYLTLCDVALPQQGLPKGDARVLSIAAASILAKVSRDRLMVELDAEYPGYGMARHKGYGTPQHSAALGRLGPCPAHRFSFAPLRNLAPDAGRASPEAGNLL